MQAAKDTFLKTLASRLAVFNPARTVAWDGIALPAVIAVENETAMAASEVSETFVLFWQGAQRTMPESDLMYEDCRLTYSSKGTESMFGTDRGRTINAMQQELRQIAEPRWAMKYDYTQKPPALLGSNIFWTRPVTTEVTVKNGRMSQTATIRVFFFPEAG